MNKVVQHRFNLGGKAGSDVTDVLVHAASFLPLADWPMVLCMVCFLQVDIVTSTVESVTAFVKAHPSDPRNHHLVITSCYGFVFSPSQYLEQFTGLFYNLPAFCVSPHASRMILSTHSFRHYIVVISRIISRQIELICFLL